MEFLDALHQLELTYRIAILCAVVMFTLFYTRDYITERLECLPAKLEFYLDNFFGTLLLISVIGTGIGIARFGIQLIIGV